MIQAGLVFLGGGLGALGRWLFGLLAARLLGTAWPWGTLGVNVIGGFAMGLTMAILLRGGSLGVTSENWRLFLATGILGGFTTFSAFSLESARMIEAGHWGQAGLYAMASVCLSVLALFAGMALGRMSS
ncbi:putative fluoride ion transporter CrcB [Candidatus Phycosocius bacilliformis]|uniref:Fluoride-specific ion channel FluC n=1 Tax=Candidatus Phycosocius bacilliformis TaxID=1445552 RepID=A0A2P2EBN6_9PROT|nr:fluoride efflux transporter CrcB [Candidatus Phycosocius bacilliformis]GBF58485.1 putative fluoride ion transporter CrcB [Candidatus Phycosocius bacilliformis]